MLQLKVEFHQTFHPHDLVSDVLEFFSGNLLHYDVVSVIAVDRQTNLKIDFGIAAGVVVVVQVLAMVICQMLKRLSVRDNSAMVD